MNQRSWQAVLGALLVAGIALLAWSWLRPMTPEAAARRLAARLAAAAPASGSARVGQFRRILEASAGPDVTVDVPELGHVSGTASCAAELSRALDGYTGLDLALRNVQSSNLADGAVQLQARLRLDGTKGGERLYHERQFISSWRRDGDVWRVTSVEFAVGDDAPPEARP